MCAHPAGEIIVRTSTWNSNLLTQSDNCDRSTYEVVLVFGSDEILGVPNMKTTINTVPMCKCRLTFWDVLLLAEVIGAVRLSALGATAPSVAQETQFRRSFAVHDTFKGALGKLGVRRRPLPGCFLRALSGCLLLILLFVFWSRVPVSLGAFLVFLQDLRSGAENSWFKIHVFTCSSVGQRQELARTFLK